MGEKITEQKIEYPQFDSITSKHSIKSISSNNITLSFGTRSTMPSCEVKLKKTDELLFTIDIEDNEKKAPIVFIKKNIVILDKEIEINPKLVLSDFKGEALHNETLIVNAAGLENSLRKMRDGYTYFGTNAVHNNFIVNDYIIQPICKFKDKFLFYIKFNRAQRKYYLKTHSNSIFSKLNHKTFTPLSFSKHSKRYIQIGKELIAFTKKSKSIEATINSNTYTFDESKVITIGRLQSCSITIESNILSKINCEIRYNFQIEQWEICDGYRGKASTNGTWLLCNEKFELRSNSNDDYIKIENCIIKVSKFIQRC